MTETPHSHLCSDCGFEWDHDDSECDLGNNCDCEDCLVKQIYWVEETFTTIGFRLPKAPDREPNPLERQLMVLGGFKSTAEMDRHYGNVPSDSAQKDTNPQQLNRDGSKLSPGRERPESENSRSIEEANTAIEFSADRQEFNEAVKCLLGGASGTEQDRLEFADVNARTSEVEFVKTGACSGFLAGVRTKGYARVPLRVFKRISRAIRTLREDTIEVSIGTGVIKVARLVFSHPEISRRRIGARIADLPMDAGLPDVLALSLRFRPEEIEDSGLLATVLAAEAEASRLVDQAYKTLKSLDIDRDVLSKLVSEQIKRRADRKNNQS
jgi:hypothetical protein